MDPTSGIATVCCTQIVPTLDSEVLKVWKEAEEALYGGLGLDIAICTCPCGNCKLLWPGRIDDGVGWEINILKRSCAPFI